LSKRLTVATVAQAKAGQKRREIADGGCAGLYLCVHPSGQKSWAVRFRSPIERDDKGQRKAKKLTLGTVAEVDSNDAPEIGRPLTLSQARTLATAALDKVRRKIDPTHERRADVLKIKTEAVKGDGTIDAAMTEFLQRYRGKKKQGIRESTRLLTATFFGLKRDPDNNGEWIKTKRGVLASWSGRPLASISKSDVIALVEKIHDGKHGVKANRTLTTLKTFFHWALKRDMLAISPAALVDAPAAEKSRERFLTDVELKALWNAAGDYSYPYGDLVRLLILTGARRDELRKAPWSEFVLEKVGWLPEVEYQLDAGLWKLPADRAKNGREHWVPLVPAVVDILGGLHRIKPTKGKPALLFTMTGDTPFSALSGAKVRLDARMLTELKRINPKAKLEPWTLHDLRRTFTSGLQRLGFPIEVTEACTNHVSGTLRGVAGTYARYKYLREKTEALQAWAHYVDNLANGKSAKVTELAMRRVLA
jgi:integrase